MTMLDMTGWRFTYQRHRGTLFAALLMLAIFSVYIANHPAGFSWNVIQTAANKSTLLAFVAAAQALVVITGGIDLSAGMILVLSNCLASWVVVGGVLPGLGGVALVLTASLGCGLLNGALVVIGRLQPIVATIATSACYYGLALLLRPFPGGGVEETLADPVTSKIAETIPASWVFLAVVVALVWVPFSRSIYGRAAYAAGSAESAAFMSGLPLGRAKLVTYALSGLLSGVAGLYLTFFSYTGEAAYASGSAYTLYSIAAVVLGGVSLAGGRGSAVGAVFGAIAFRSIGDLLFVFDLDPLWQPLFQGLVLLAAVSLGAVSLISVRNRLEWFP
jgi:simple sugar transport system permease protein/ribose transport system permease protein